MNPEIKRDWIDALTGDKFQQTLSALKGSGGYCCLGVLCEIQGATSAELLDKYESKVDPRYAAGLSVELQNSLARLNDRGMTFEQIAQVIEVFA